MKVHDYKQSGQKVMVKVNMTVSIKPELVLWIDEQVKKRDISLIETM